MSWQDQQQATVLVEWTIASEVDTAGFNLHRAENPEEPFIDINQTLIPASADPLTGSSYSYEDHQVQPGVLYYYRLEEVELDGGSSYFGPISVQAAGASSLGFSLSLAVIAVGGVNGVTLLSRARRRAGEESAGLPEIQQ